MTAVTVAVLSAVMVASTQLAGVAAADETFGEYTVGGRILEAYTDTGGQAKWGNPTMNEAPAAERGRFQRFDNTSFYWKATVAGGVAHQIGGAIRARWGTVYNYERGPLGYPTTNEVDAGGKGRKQFFQGGNMYYGRSTGTHVVWGKILDIYAAKGGPGAFYGLPVGDEYRADGRFAQDFQGGTILWP